jgi:hypothetical protein
MHVEVTRILTEWLRDEDWGVNAMLAALPHQKYDEDGEAETEDLPPAVDIYNDVDSDAAQGVLGVDPPTVPSIVVVADSAPEITDIRQSVKPGHAYQAIVGVGYYAEKDFRASAIIAGNYTLRAVKQSLKLYNQPQTHPFSRELNQIHVVRIDSVTMQRVAGGTVGNSALLGFLLADVTVLDKAP